MCMQILDNLSEEMAKVEDSNEIQEVAKPDGNTTEEKTVTKKETKPEKKSASNTTFKIHPITKMTTRKRRLLKGLKLVNPIKYFDCLLCKAGFYKEAELRKHYGKK